MFLELVRRSEPVVATSISTGVGMNNLESFEEGIEMFQSMQKSYRMYLNGKNLFWKLLYSTIGFQIGISVLG